MRERVSGMMAVWGWLSPMYGIWEGMVRLKKKGNTVSKKVYSMYSMYSMYIVCIVCI